MEKNVIISLPFKGNALTFLTETGRPVCTKSQNFQEYKDVKKKEGIEISLISWDEFHVLNNKYWESDFTEISEEKYYDALEVLPPLEWHSINETINVFFSCEAMSGIFHFCYIQDKSLGKYFTALKSINISDAEILAKYSQSKF